MDLLKRAAQTSPLSSEFRKLLRMALLGLRHDRTHSLLLTLLACLATKRGLKLALHRARTRALAAAALQNEEAMQSLEQEATRPLHRSPKPQSPPTLAQTAPTGSMRRVMSETLIRSRVPAGTLCADCLAHACSHVEKLSRNWSCSQLSSMRLGERKGELGSSGRLREQRLSHEVHPEVCEEDEGCCIVCSDSASMWATLMRRALGVLAGAFAGYCLWLRFFASHESVIRHLARVVRMLAALFRYRVEHANVIPKEGGALITVYHGFIPLDMYFLHEWLYSHTGKLPCTLAADFVFRIPLLGWAARLCGARPAGRAAALDALREGRVVVVAPGGVREGMSSTTSDYNVNWFGRKGFAEVAQMAQVPIIPLFTRNIRELFLVLGSGNPVVTKLYQLTRLPFTPFLGPVPVPLTSVLGDVLPFDTGKTAAIVAQEAEEAMRALIRRNCPMPTSSVRSYDM